MRRAILLVGGVVAGVPRAALAQSATAVFSTARRDLLAAYADTLIPTTDTPGALGAGVPLAIDAMMRDWASAETRQQFDAVLDALDAEARKVGGTGLAAMPPARRKPIVAAFDAARIAVQARDVKPGATRDEPASDAEQIVKRSALDASEPGTAGAEIASAPPAGDNGDPAPANDSLAALNAPYLRLKELVLITYYLSEPGATQELRYELIPGVWDAEMPLGPDRRAWAV